MIFIELGCSQERPSGGAQGSSPRQENAIGGQEGGGRGEKTRARLGKETAPRQETGRQETGRQETATYRQKTVCCGEEARRQEAADQGQDRLCGSQQGEAGRQEAGFCRQEDRCERQEGAGSGEKPRRCQEIGSRYGEISTEGQETGRRKANEAKKPSGVPGKAPVPGKKAPPAAPKPAADQAQAPAPAAKQAAGPKLAPLARPEPLTVRQVPARATPMITPIMPRAPIASWIKKPTPPVKKAAIAKKPPVKLGPLVRLTPEDYQPVPVKHQRWTTRNVAVAAPGDRPLWRVGLTRILQDCDFSHFDRMDRTIMMIDGLGFELDFGANGTALLDRRYNPVEFRGEWATRCRLVSGPVEVINVITDRRRATHHVTVMAVGMNERLRDLKGEASVIFCLVGEAELVLGKERFVLAAGETLRSTVRGRMSCRAATTSALIYVIEVKKR